MKALDDWRLDGRFLIGLDGTGVVRFHQRHCPWCLTQMRPDGTTLYMHQVLLAMLLTPSGLALPVGWELIDNRDGASKQDCELKAFDRLAPRLKARFPRLPVTLLGDALYACKRFFRACRDSAWRFIITLKESDLPAVWSEFQALSALAPQDRVRRRPRREVEQTFTWVNDLMYDGHALCAFDCRESAGPQGPRLFYGAWITNVPLGCASVISYATIGGRLRWKIENEGIDVLKHHGYALEHAYSRNPCAAENFLSLMMIAFILNQLMVHGTLRKLFGQALGSVRNYLLRLAEALRGQLISPDALDEAKAASIHIPLTDTS